MSSLKQKLTAGEFIIAPGIYDGLSARIAEAQGFGALYLSGYAVSASLLGQPDAGFLTGHHMADRVRMVKQVARTPLIADADTGFGGVAQLIETVRAYEEGGAAAIQLEDQVSPKRCGHTKGRDVLPVSEAATKIKAAVSARKSDEFLIIARTDARTSHGLEACFRRADAFLDAGADIIFIESPDSVEELTQIGLRYRDQWLLANMVGGGRTPLCAPEDLEAMGFNLSIHPLFALGAVAESLQGAYGRVHQHWEEKELPFSQLNKLVGFEEIWALDEAFKALEKDNPS